MSAKKRILNVKVGESVKEAGARAAATMKAIQRGERTAPYFGVSFVDRSGAPVAAAAKVLVVIERPPSAGVVDSSGADDLRGRRRRCARPGARLQTTAACHR